MKIVELKAENVKRLSAVEIIPKNPVVVVGGKNAAGKSSVLDSIAYTLGGKSLLPSEPLRRGEKKGSVTIQLDGDEAIRLPALSVTRTFTAKGTTSLTVTAPDGVKIGSPQSLLDSLCGRIAFDPLEFSRMAPAKQSETLRSLVGLDFSEDDAKRATLYAKRTEVNREAKSTKMRLDATPLHHDAPATAVVVADLLGDLEEAQSTNRAKDDAKQAACTEEQCIATIARECRQVITTVEGLKAELAEAERDLARLTAARKRADERAKQFTNEVEGMPEVECEPIHERIRNAEATNEKVRSNARRKLLATEHARLLALSTATSDAIEAIDDDKQKQLESAKWPVDGLGFSDDGITFGGLPFEQASSAEQLRVAVAIGLALNPTLRVLLIRDGSLLDGDNLEAISEMASEADAQVWLERVGDDGHCAVVIEDGQIKPKGEGV